MKAHTSFALRLAAAAIVGTAAFAPAHAAIVTFNTPIAIPNTFNGVYINLATGANATTTAAVPGWDFGPWGSSNTLSFFWPSTPAASSGGVGTTTAYTDLPNGTVISSASTWLNSASNTATTAFQSTGTHTVGFRFFNESTSAINYGYARISTTGPLGFPATITSWSFENTGAAITVVPEPGTGIMLAMGALALGMMVRRQRKQA